MTTSEKVQLAFETEEEVEENAKLYRHPDVVEQRRRFVDIARPPPGSRCLDVGCGQGFLLEDIARAVGREGQVHGVDVSERMLLAARKRCPEALLQRASAVSLPYCDDVFDLVVVCQVLVYVSRPEKAVREALRCLKPGGRLVILDSIWSQSAWHVSDAERQRRVLVAFDKHALHPTLPMRIPALLSTAGFSYEYARAIPIVGTSWETSWGRLVAPVIAKYVLDRGLVEEADVDGWIKDLQTQANEDRFFFNINRYVFVAKKESLLRDSRAH